MKFRALSGTDIIVSEVGYAIASLPGGDPLVAARLTRLAYDEGINFFVLPSGSIHDAALAPAFAGLMRSKVCLAASLAWPGAVAFERLQSALEFRLGRLGTDRVDLLLLRDIPEENLLDGSAADVVHRLRVAGKVRAVGLGTAHGAPASFRAVNRAGATVVEVDALSAERPSDPRVSALARLADFSSPSVDHLSFLWDGTGRSRLQALIALALASPSVCTTVIGPVTADELMDAARAPLASPLTDAELSAARAGRPVLTQA